MAERFEILMLNQISPVGLRRLPPERYAVSKDTAHPDAILVRSADMHPMTIPDSVKAIGRAGAGTNNIPVPAMSKRGLLNAQNLAHARAGAILLNFSREGVVDDRAVLAALGAHRLKGYVTDFPAAPLAGHPGVIALPHLGASTREAEENSAVMVVDQLRDYLEHGNVRNAVNFPDVAMARESPFRVAIANANVPNMVGQISTAMAKSGLNIHNMLNKSKGEMAYTVADVDSAVPREVIATIRGIAGVLAIRYLPHEG
jgi:D-3-phosphoglycerate dehydrogenase